MKITSRLRTIGALFLHFVRRERLFLAPLVIVLVLAGLLLVATSGLSFVAPFVYAIF